MKGELAKRIADETYRLYRETGAGFVLLSTGAAPLPLRESHTFERRSEPLQCAALTVKRLRAYLWEKRAELPREGGVLFAVDVPDKKHVKVGIGEMVPKNA